MAEKTMLQRIAPDELPDLLTRLNDERATDLALIGTGIELATSPNDWPQALKGCVVFQLTRALSKLPPELLQLDRLQVLTLWKLGLNDKDVAAIAKHLGQLTALDLSINDVSDAGVQSICNQLKHLTVLGLGNIVETHSSGTYFSHAGNCIGDTGVLAIAQHLGQLTRLDLYNNQVGEIGAIAIAENLDQLTWLDLNSNQVGEAGAMAIAENLGQLTTLFLGSNQVGEAGAMAIAENLGQLTMLFLGSNQVGEVGAMAIAENLGQLTALDLEDNDISNKVIVTIGQNINGLTELNLKSNKRITTIAPLAHLPLSTLNIAMTGVADLSPLKPLILKGLPVRWTAWSSSKPGIFVQDCPLTYPSPEVVSQGTDAVLNFVREVEAQGMARLFEAKLLIIGEGGAGKTSLLLRMFLPKMSLPTVDETTRGIDIHRHEFPLANGRTFRLNTWDFGGQQIYHATHQFFLTKRSLYILVDDTRSDSRSIYDEGFKFWLEVVETLSENSPLLIFQNEKGGRSKQLDEAGIKGRFTNVQEFHQGNLEHSGAADSLCQAVEYFAQRLPHIGENVPAKWVTIRDDLKELAQSHPYISLTEYLTVYKRHLEDDRDKALKLSQYLHDLGVFLHFLQPRELRQTVFLQNQWVTDAVFHILDDERVKSQRGRFTLSDCDRLWSEQGYINKEVELRALMLRFELCYRLPDIDEETWLVPQHLTPSKPPELSDWDRIDDLMLTYRYEFLPRGLVSRLIVRMHRFVKQPDLCWSRGALFEHNGSQVLVATTTRGNEILLRSRGPEKKALLSVIASDLDALNNSFQGLNDKVSKWVPCICDTCTDLKDPAIFEQKELIERKRRGKTTIECPKPPDYADINVLELLDGMNLKQWLEQASKELSPNDDEAEASENSNPSEPESSVDAKTIRIFLASSAELREDRDKFDLYFRQQNDRLRKQGLYLEIIRWENFLDAMSNTRLQDEYNEEIRNCDIFVSLFMTKTGKYTKEEFDIAHKTFKDTGKPLIYTYFREAKVSTRDVNIDALTSLINFKQRLKELEHFYTEYELIDGLQKHFRDQLNLLWDKGLL